MCLKKKKNTHAIFAWYLNSRSKPPVYHPVFSDRYLLRREPPCTVPDPSASHQYPKTSGEHLRPIMDGPGIPSDQWGGDGVAVTCWDSQWHLWYRAGFQCGRKLNTTQWDNRERRKGVVGPDMLVLHWRMCVSVCVWLYYYTCKDLFESWTL